MMEQAGETAAAVGTHTEQLSQRVLTQHHAQREFMERYYTANQIVAIVGVTRSAITWAYRNGKLPLPVVADAVLLWSRTPELEKALQDWKQLQALRYAAPSFA